LAIGLVEIPICASPLPQVRVLGNSRGRLFKAGDEAPCGNSVVSRYVIKNLVKIREGAAFIPDFHARR
jgi:hypothetical protein